MRALAVLSAEDFVVEALSAAGVGVESVGRDVALASALPDDLALLRVQRAVLALVPESTSELPADFTSWTLDRLYAWYVRERTRWWLEDSV